MEYWVDDQKASTSNKIDKKCDGTEVKRVPIANIMGTHFNLYSTFEDAWNEKNSWKVCKFDEECVAFPSRCGPESSSQNQNNQIDLNQNNKDKEG